MTKLDVSQMEIVNGGLFGLGGRYESCIDMTLSFITSFASTFTSGGLAIGFGALAFAYGVDQAGDCEHAMSE